MATEPIIVDCEGTGCFLHNFVHGLSTSGICSMCGQVVTAVNGAAAPHQRQDIVAMLERGDFDG